MSNDKARRLLALHTGPVLILPNAWDAASAAVIAAAGAHAIATTSGGVSWSLGHADNESLTRTDQAAAIARISAAVDIPVTADIEAGYGPTPADVAATVTAVVAAGAAGVNLEDHRPDGTLYTPDEQAERIAAARTAATAAGVPDLVINARTDVYLFGIGAPTDRAADVTTRGHAYAAAGADCLFVPGLMDLDTLTDLVTHTPIPVNAMAMPGGPTIAALAATGVRRISIGTFLAQAAYTAARDAAHELLTEGTYNTLDDLIAYPDLNALLTR